MIGLLDPCIYSLVRLNSHHTPLLWSTLQHTLGFLLCKIWCNCQVQLESGIQDLDGIYSGHNVTGLGEYLPTKSFTQLVPKWWGLRVREVRQSSRAQNLTVCPKAQLSGWTTSNVILKKKNQNECKKFMINKISIADFSFCLRLQ